MSRWDAESDLDYQEQVERPYSAVEMPCVDCGVVVFIARDEPYPGPALRCRACAESRPPITLRETA